MFTEIRVSIDRKQHQRTLTLANKAGLSISQYTKVAIEMYNNIIANQLQFVEGLDKKKD